MNTKNYYKTKKNIFSNAFEDTNKLVEDENKF